MDLTRWRELRWQASALRANIQLKTQSPGTAFGKHTPTWIRSLERCNSWVKSGRHCRDGRRLARRSYGPAPRTVSSAGGSSFDRGDRSEEHTSELQSLAYLVCRLLLEKKKNIMQQTII